MVMAERCGLIELSEQLDFPSVCCFLISACRKGQTLSSDEVIKGTNPYFLFRENVIIVNFSTPIKYPEKQFKRPLQPHQTRPTGKGKLKLPDIKA